MKKIILIIILLFIPACVHYPSAKDMPANSPASCLDYQRCLYYAVKGKLQIDCSKVYDRCDKDRAWVECSGNRPDDMKFQECWDKKR